jgi:hypothetical protein
MVLVWHEVLIDNVGDVSSSWNTMSLTERLRYGFISTREDGLGNIVELLLRLADQQSKKGSRGMEES